MGTWGASPFENDSAADFINSAQGSPSRAVTSALQKITKLPPARYIEVDGGAAAWAACELVALAFGRGDASTLRGAARDVLTRLRPEEEQRLLALDVLPRIADPERSELAELWHEDGDGGQGFDARIADLRARLEDAGQRGSG
jgi:hypothetical protein